MTTNEPTSLDLGELRQHIQGANPAIMLASLVGITGDSSRIAQFVPQLSHSFGPTGMDSALPEAERAELDAWAWSVLSDLDSYRDRDVHEVEDSVFLELAAALVGWPAQPESLPFLREQAGFVSFVPTVPRTRTAPADFKVAIIGAGMAGIAMSIAAKHEGIDYVVLEKAEGVGGVWWQNTYPGVGVDTPSKYYSFSFEINPEWTHSHPEGGQYLRYLGRVAEKYRVIDNFEFGAEVTSAVWDEADSVWLVTYVQDGQPLEIRANAVVTAAGYLTNSQLPDVPGIESFAGQWFHSADWDHDLDFSGKRIAVVGTGCTAVQIVDALSDKVEALSLFQRQPHWVLPSSGKEELPESERWLLANVPSYSTWSRLHTFLPIGDANYDSVRYDEEWAATHDLSISAHNDAMLQVALGYLEESFADRPDLKELLRPNFAFMGKRPIRDPGEYYSTIKKPTTSLVTTGLSKVVPEGIIDGDGALHEVDVIIYATGFTLEYLSNWAIVGKGGRTLNDVWQDSPSAYNGCLVPGFPNLFVTSGPNASAAHGGGHNFTVEAVVHYVIESLQSLFEAGASHAEVTPEAYERWGDEIRERMKDSVWAREMRATTYYRNAKGEVILASPLKMEDYWNRLRSPDLADLVVR